jgi:hypothetical protein
LNDGEIAIINVRPDGYVGSIGISGDGDGEKEMDG